MRARPRQTLSPQTKNSPTLLKTAKEKNQNKILAFVSKHQMQDKKIKKPSYLLSKYLNLFVEGRFTYDPHMLIHHSNVRACAHTQGDIPPMSNLHHLHLKESSNDENHLYQRFYDTSRKLNKNLYYVFENHLRGIWGLRSS